MRMGNGVVFAVAGSKGGVGKTTTSINLSSVLAESGYDTVLVEMDLAMANVGDFLDLDVRLEGEDPTLHEALAGTVSVVDTTYSAPGGFDVLPSGATLRGFVNTNVEAVSGILATLRFAYDVVIVDTGAGVMPSTVVSLALADETVLVSSPRVASVRDTKKTRDLTRQVGGTVAGVVFVRSGTGRSPGVDHIAEFLSVDLLGHVPEDSAVASAQDTGRPVVVAERDSDAARAYRTLGESIADRVEALGATKSTTLSADRRDRDGSGFAFIDTPDESEEDAADVHEDDTTHHDQKPGANAASVAAHATNGRVRNRNGRDTDTCPSSSRRNGTPVETDAMELADESSDADGTETTETVEDDSGEPDDGTDVGVAERNEPSQPDDSDDSDDTGSSRGVDDTDRTDADDTGPTDADHTERTDDGNTGSTDTDHTERTDDGNTGSTDTGDAEQPDVDDADGGDSTEASVPVGATGTTNEDTERDDSDHAESDRSAPRRFIDKAIGLVDRGDD